MRALRAAGIDAVGWDPHFAPDRSVLAPRDVVNLGFVLNVVEDPAERRDLLRRAFDLAERCLAVAVMLVGKGDVSGHRPHGDGFLSSRGTFQRYYTQAELRTFLLDTLEVTPVAAGPGIFFLFRDEELEQRVLSRRQMGMVGFRPILSVPRSPSTLVSGTSWRQEALNSVRDDLVDLLLTMGRVPHVDEMPPDLRTCLAGARVPIKAAMAAALATIPAEEMAATAARRADEIGRFFALGAFSGRARYRRLSPDLQRDVRAFFGSLAAAEGVGRRMLFDAGDAEALAKEAQAHATAGLGHLSGDKYQVHARDLPRLTSRLRTYIGIAQTLAGTLDSTTIYRVHLASRKLTALLYPDFDTSALPRLSSRRTPSHWTTGPCRNAGLTQALWTARCFRNSVQNWALRLGNRPFQRQRSSIGIPVGTSAASARSIVVSGTPSMRQAVSTWRRLRAISAEKSARTSSTRGPPVRSESCSAYSIVAGCSWPVSAMIARKVRPRPNARR